MEVLNRLGVLREGSILACLHSKLAEAHHGLVQLASQRNPMLVDR